MVQPLDVNSHPTNSTCCHSIYYTSVQPGLGQAQLEWVFAVKPGKGNGLNILGVPHITSVFHVHALIAP